MKGRSSSPHGMARLADGSMDYAGWARHEDGLECGLSRWHWWFGGRFHAAILRLDLRPPSRPTATTQLSSQLSKSVSDCCPSDSESLTSELSTLVANKKVDLAQQSHSALQHTMLGDGGSVWVVARLPCACALSALIRNTEPANLHAFGLVRA